MCCNVSTSKKAQLWDSYKSLSFQVFQMASTGDSYWNDNQQFNGGSLYISSAYTAWFLCWWGNGRQENQSCLLTSETFFPLFHLKHPTCGKATGFFQFRSNSNSILVLLNHSILFACTKDFCETLSYVEMITKIYCLKDIPKKIKSSVD